MGGRWRGCRRITFWALSRITIRWGIARRVSGWSSWCGMDAAKVALGLVLTAPFVPMLFMGEEFAASTPFLVLRRS